MVLGGMVFVNFFVCLNVYPIIICNTRGMKTAFLYTPHFPPLHGLILHYAALIFCFSSIQQPRDPVWFNQPVFNSCLTHLKLAIPLKLWLNDFFWFGTSGHVQECSWMVFHFLMSFVRPSTGEPVPSRLLGRPGLITSENVRCSSDAPFLLNNIQQGFQTLWNSKTGTVTRLWSKLPMQPLYN